MVTKRTSRVASSPSLSTAYVRLPWWFHLLTVPVVYWVCHYSFFRMSPWLSGVNHTTIVYASVVLSAIPVCLTLLSVHRAWKKRTWLFAQTTLRKIRTLTWQEFEVLIGVAFERLGYRVIPTGGGGADGGKDLILTKKGKRVLAQCKHWKSTSVGAPVVREMYGLMVAEKMDAVLIVTSGKFTREATAFAQGKPIVLVNGAALVKLIGELKGA